MSVIIVYIICLALFILELLGVGSEPDSPLICLPDVSIKSGFCPLVLFSFTRCITTPWKLNCNGFSAVYYLESLEVSALRGSFDVFSVRAA